MKNRLLFPEDSQFNLAQRAKIKDIWVQPPIGLKALSGKTEFPDLMIYPSYRVGRGNGRDARGISLQPVAGQKFELVVVDSMPEYQPLNPNISPGQVLVERGEFYIGPNKSFDRYALSTRVSPTRCEMTYHAILDVDPRQLVGAEVGRIWANTAILEKEEECREWRRTHPTFSDFF